LGKNSLVLVEVLSFFWPANESFQAIHVALVMTSISGLPAIVQEWVENMEADEAYEKHQREML
jgi:hypothetical protein